MRYRTGSNVMSEEELRIKEKYKKIRKKVKAEELAIMFQQKTEIELKKYSKIFDQIKKNEGEGFFSYLNTKVGREELKELIIKFFRTINPEWENEIEGLFNETNPKVKLIFCEDDEKYRADHCILKVTGAGIIFPEGMLETIKIDNPDLYDEIIELNKDKTIISINVFLTDSLNDIYNLIHEITHYFTFGDTESEIMLSEVAPQCMERVLDDFLLQLSEEELSKYNFKKEELSKDIRKRRIISFTSRYNSTKDFNEKNKNKNFGDKEEELLKYFLAQFFQSQFRKFNADDKKKKIIEFIEYLKDNNFEMASKIFGVEWTNKLKMEFYIDNMIEDIQKDLEVKHKDKKEEINNFNEKIRIEEL